MRDKIDAMWMSDRKIQLDFQTILLFILAVVRRNELTSMQLTPMTNLTSNLGPLLLNLLATHAHLVEKSKKEIEALQKQIAAKLGYRLVDHRLELYGVRLDREG